jgi:hypothetical protein
MMMLPLRQDVAAATASPSSNQAHLALLRVGQFALTLTLGIVIGSVGHNVDVAAPWRELSSRDEPADGGYTVVVEQEPPCDSSGLPPIPALLERAWVYDELSPAETAYVANWFMRNADFDVNASMAGGLVTGNALSGTEAVVVVPPPKDAARAYVNGTTDEPPPRMAKVTVVRGLATPPDVMVYQVGPLLGCDAGNCAAPSISPGSKIVPLTKPGQIPYAKRPYDLSDDTMLAPTFAAMYTLMPMLTAEFGKIWDWVPGCAPGECWDNMEGRSMLVPYNDMSSSADSRISRYTLNWYRTAEQVQVQWVHEIPLIFRLNQTSADPGEWFLFNFTYCAHYDSVFATPEELLAAYQANQLPSCYIKPDPATEGSLGACIFALWPRACASLIREHSILALLPPTCRG